MIILFLQKGVPLIYLPLHKSHLDYVLVTFLLWNIDIRAPYVAAGDNLDIPFFGYSNSLILWRIKFRQNSLIRDIFTTFLPNLSLQIFQKK